MKPSSEASEVLALWYWVSRLTTWLSGAIARPDSITAAITPPMDTLPDMISYTPSTSMATDSSCWMKPAKFIVDAARIFSREPTWARNSVACSHLPCSTPSAASTLTVSSPDRLSTR